MSDEICLQRGLVAHALYAQYPHVLTELALSRQVQQLLLDGAVLERVMAYLEERGLAERAVSKVGNRSIVTYRLTADGVNVVEGTAGDAGIDLGLAQ